MSQVNKSIKKESIKKDGIFKIPSTFLIPGGFRRTEMPKVAYTYYYYY